MEAPEGVCLGDLYAECIRSSGVRPACEKFFKIVRPVLGRIAYRVAAQFGAKAETEDVVQEISLKLASKDLSVLAGMPKDPSASLAYFSVVAANAARDFFRSRNATKRGIDRTIPLDAALESIVGGVSRQLDRELLIKQIEDWLPEDRKSRAIFRLYYRQGFSAKEIADIPAVELSVKGVESLIHRAILQLRQKLVKPAARPLADGNPERNPSMERED
jgi:RNA polymerase sigma-70 factor (ECF subfamily)